MVDVPYVVPEFNRTAFNCPHCSAYSSQSWFAVTRRINEHFPVEKVSDVAFSKCLHCKRYSLWYDEMMLMPAASGLPPPNSDLGAEVLADYEEARSIVERSPRGAAALLRLALERLCEDLGQTGKDLNANIAELVKAGLPVFIQQSLDVVRVIGNNAVHPGVMDLRDDKPTAAALFVLVNSIATVMISDRRQVAEMYEALPETVREQIQKRDGGQATH